MHYFSLKITFLPSPFSDQHCAINTLAVKATKKDQLQLTSAEPQLNYFAMVSEVHKKDTHNEDMNTLFASIHSKPHTRLKDAIYTIKCFNSSTSKISNNVSMERPRQGNTHSQNYIQ